MPKCYSYIRFSSEKQSQSDSVRRQLELSEKYAEQNDLTLDDTLNMMDLGLSAFQGDHIEKGHLGNFLTLIEKGGIEKGSILLVESLDRLSREKITTAFKQFLSIIESGITIVTLQDNQSYTPSSIDANMNQLIISITIMSRAYEESRAKQLRVSSAWEEKRKNAHTKILTSKCPHWMVLNKERTRFKLIPERAELVNRMFQMYLDGNGTDVIAKKFNEEKIPTWGRAKLWGKSYIWKILRERTTIGEYQPKKFNEKRKTIPAGDPIVDYYPAVITKQLFYKAQSQLEQRRTNFGKTGTYSNLFSHIAKCGYCGSSMNYVNKGKPPKGGKYLVCDRARRGGGCIYRTIHYQEFEDSILQISAKLDIKDIIEDKTEETEIKIIYTKDEINKLEYQIEESNRKISEWLILYNEIDDIAKTSVKNKIEDEHIIIETLTELLNENINTLDNLKSREEETSKTLSDLYENISAMSEYSGHALYDIRRKVKIHFQNIIASIKILSLGVPWDNTIEPLKALVPETVGQLYDIDDDDVKKMSKDNRRFVVQFKDGGFVSAKYDTDSEQYLRIVEVEDIANMMFTVGKISSIKWT